MELSKEHLIAFDEILKKYQTEYGEQEYKMYYDVDLPKIMMEAVNAYANSVERLLKAEIEHSKAQEPFIKHILKQLENLKP